MIKVGVTGRRDISCFNKVELIKNIRLELDDLKRGREKFIMLNSIAAGADQLCAQLGLELGYELICPLPFSEYRNDFSCECLEQYDTLLGKSTDSFVVSDNTDKDAAYLAAGKYIAKNCDVLLAVWNRKPNDSACGTDAVVVYAQGLGKNVRILSDDLT